MKNIFLLVLILSLFFGCDTNDGVRMIEINGGHKVWTKKIGDNPDIILDIIPHKNLASIDSIINIIEFFCSKNSSDIADAIEVDNLISIIRSANKTSKTIILKETPSKFVYKVYVLSKDKKNTIIFGK